MYAAHANTKGGKSIMQAARYFTCTLIFTTRTLTRHTIDAGFEPEINLNLIMALQKKVCM